MLDRRPREHERIAAQNVVDVDARLRQHVDLGQVARRAGELLVDRSTRDDQHGVPAELLELRAERLGLGVLLLGFVDHPELALGLICRERTLETQPANLLLQAVAVVAHHRPEDHRATAELRRAQTALPRPPGALLAPGLLGGALDVADTFGRVGPGTALGELPVDDAREDVAANRCAEYRVGEIDLAHVLVVEVLDRDLHLTRLPSSAPRPRAPRPLP